MTAMREMMWRYCGWTFGWQDGAIIMTQATTKGHLTAGGNHCAIALIVIAKRSHVFHVPGLTGTTGLNLDAVIIWIPAVVAITVIIIIVVVTIIIILHHTLLTAAVVVAAVVAIAIADIVIMIRIFIIVVLMESFILH